MSDTAIAETWQPAFAEWMFEVVEAESVSEWADAHRVLDVRTSAEPGPWQTGRTPYLREIMDAFSDPGVEQITFMKSTQVGGTEAMLNMLGWAVCNEPGPALICMSKEDMARDVSRLRVRPMFQSSSALRDHVPGGVAETLMMFRYELDAMDVHWAWAGSPSQLATFAVKFFFADEVDKYPPFSGREADPIKLGMERTRTFKASRKVVLASTPTTTEGYINREYETSDRRKYYVPCPHCGHHQVLRFDQVQWPETERDPERIRMERLAQYECEVCKGRIGDGDKPKMLDDGVWCPDGRHVTKRGKLGGPKGPGRRRGYWINALYSPWLTFSDVAAEFLESKDDPAKFMNFMNSWLGQVWHEKAEELDRDDVIELEIDLAQYVVPEPALVLFAGADYHKHRVDFTVRAWAPGRESWLVDCGSLGDLARLDDAVLDKTYQKADGTPLQVFVMGLDSGYRTDEVYAFSRARSDRVYAVKGANERMVTPWHVCPIDKDSHGKAVKGAHRYWRIDTHYYKDMVFALSRPESGKWHLFNGVPGEYITQFCGEHKIIKRDKYGQNVERWVPKAVNANNHFWDCEVMGVAVADIRYVWNLRAEPAAAQGRTGQERQRFRTPDGRAFLVTER